MWNKIHFLFFFFFFFSFRREIVKFRNELRIVVNKFATISKKKKKKGGDEEIKRNVENEANEESYEVNVRDLKFGTINFLLRQTGSDGCNSIYESRARRNVIRKSVRCTLLF